MELKRINFVVLAASRLGFVFSYGQGVGLNTFDKECAVSFIRTKLGTETRRNVEALAMWRYSVFRLPEAASD